MAQAPERTVVINGSGGGSGGMGMGIMLGAILVVVLGIGLLWFVMSGSGTDKPIAISPTINIGAPEINVPATDIKIPDTITINPPVNAPAP
ncbi:MAG: hypothetical protein HW403_561 [Dehalococcoidia bacterium]|nr:hypothetical protein [Dehalococcoidia bacterium]